MLVIVGFRFQKLHLVLSIPDVDPKSYLHINTINPSNSLLVKLGDVTLPKFHQLLLPFKHKMMQESCVPVDLVKWYRIRQIYQAKLLLSVASLHCHAAVVNADPYIGVSDGDVEGEVVVKISTGAAVTAAEIELG